jgi:acyl carrier protein
VDVPEINNSLRFILEPEIVTQATVESAVDAVRHVLSQHGRLTVDVLTLDEDFDLYGAGLTSLATVGIMLALEDRFEVEFPESMLSRSTFRSIAAITEAVSNLAG